MPPHSLSAEFHEEIVKHQRHSLELQALFQKVSKIFEERKIQHFLLKGPILSESLYDDPSLRMYSDIDFLVPYDQLAAAKEILEDLGFNALKTMPGKNWASSEQKYFRKDVPFIHSQKKSLCIEVHFRLQPPPFVYGMDWDLIDQNKKIVTYQGRSVATLSDDMNFAYLCAHGHAHAWERLDWLFDFSVFYKKILRGDLNYALEIGKKYNLWEELRSALSLARDILQPHSSLLHSSELRSNGSYRRMKSRVHSFHHLRSQGTPLFPSQKVFYWRHVSMRKLWDLFLYLKSVRYEAWITKQRPMKFYHLWLIARVPPILWKRVVGLMPS